LSEVNAVAMSEPLDPREEAQLKANVKAALFGRESAPQRIGRYALVKRLGAGAQGTVWAAYDEKLDRRVAIKLLRDPEGDDRGARGARLLREARSLARISHPNVVQVFEADQLDGGVFVVTEYVRGSTLGEWIEEHSPGPAEILRVFQAAGRGLAAAHAAGVIHRDFKPDNLLVGDDEIVKVVDFGLARADALGQNPEATSTLERRLHAENAAPSKLTADGSVLGTPVYAAPEQLRYGKSSEMSDQFSFAVVLFEALFGKLPFAATTPVARMVKIVNGEVGDYDRGGVGRSVERAVLRALSPTPTQRFPSMRHLLAALDESAPSERGWASLDRPTLAVALLAVLVLAMGVIALTFRIWATP